MKTITLTIVLLIIALFASAQNIDITGQVKDEQSNKSIEYSTVVVLSANDSIITGAVTNEKGFFSIPLKSGNYKLVCSFVGYKGDTTIINSLNENRFIGVIHLNPNTELLNGVVVTASSKSIELDKDVFIVTDSIKTGTSNTKELLERLSGITYDRFSNTIKVDNNNAIVFLVNGIEKNKEYILNLAPDRIKKVEVIRDPSGRYSLEGYTAIVNILLHTNYQGQELYVNDMLLLDPDSKYFLPLNNVYATYNYTYNKVNIYGQFRNYYNDFHLLTSSVTEYPDYSISEMPLTDSDPNLMIHEIGNSYTIGADYYLNPKHTFSFEGNYSDYPLIYNSTIDLNSTTIKNENIIDSYNYEITDNKESKNLYGSLFYTGKLSRKDEVEMSINYSLEDNDYHNNILFEQSYLEEIGNRKNSRVNTFMEYNRILNKKLSLQFGYGFKWNNLKDNYVSDDNGTLSQNQNFFTKETRHLLYSYFSWKMNKSLSLKAGVSAENSNKTNNTHTQNYSILQPHLDFMYTVSKNFKIKLKYRAKGYYPTMEQTNPFVKNINANTISYGNPSLKPYVYNRFSLRTTVFQGLFSIEPYFSYSNDYIVQIGTLNNDSIFEYTYDNSALYQNIGAKFNLTIPIYKKIIFQSDFDIYNSKIEYDNRKNHFIDWTTTTKLLYVDQEKGTVIGLQLQKNMRKDITAQGYNSNDNDAWMIFFSKPFMKKKLNVMIGYMIPTNFLVNYKSQNYIMTSDYSRMQVTDISILKNMIIFQVNYRFHKGKAIKGTKKKNFKVQKQKKGLF